ncbi:MAG: hydantoinase B/oxoprolinase family protein [Clostridia bacterium]|nr:hydantoinase B/oxoprolinase family protein [Clostridia bacterium]
MDAATDPFTLEVVKAGIEAACDEMFVALAKTSQSPIIYEVLDYATGITDAEGRLLVQGNGVTGFLGTVASAAREVVRRYAGDLRPGDVVAGNDPYAGGGTHLSDVSLVMPFFCGEELLGFGSIKAHWAEIGGANPGSFATDTPDVFSEGLQLPFVKIVAEGRENRALVETIAANVRTPEATLGDFRAQWAALAVGARRLEALARRYGVATVRLAMADILRRGEILAREALARLPKGTFTAEDAIDDDGVTGEPIPIRVRVTITGDAFTADFTGSGPTARGSINTTWAGLEAGVRTAYRALLAPELPANEGVFAPLRIVCPPGTVFTALRPAPVSTYWEASDHATDLVLKALAEACPDRLVAGHHLSVCGTILAGRVDGEERILVEPQAGGWGAGPDKDGEHALVPVGDGETYALPAEVVEARYGFEVTAFTLDVVPAGAGRRRGGRGVRKELRIPWGPVLLTASFGRHRVPPWGVAGGREGSPNAIEVEHRDGRRIRAGKLARYPLGPGDLVRFRTGTGGGWGDPRLREKELVRQDLEDGLVTPLEAVRDYGWERDEALRAFRP